MAGSYKHCVDDQGRFCGVDLLDHLGDAFEALEEMYGMIWYLASGYAEQYAGGRQREESVVLVEEARLNYKLGIERSPRVGCAMSDRQHDPVAASDRFEGTERRSLVFYEHGTHKTIRVADGPMSGALRVSDQATIDALREAFERSGWEVEDRVG